MLSDGYLLSKLLDVLFFFAVLFMAELGHVSQKNGTDIPLALISAELDFASFISHFVPTHINVLPFTTLEFRMTFSFSIKVVALLAVADFQMKHV